jgi:hypothetical protein
VQLSTGLFVTCLYGSEVCTLEYEREPRQIRGDSRDSSSCHLTSSLVILLRAPVAEEYVPVLLVSWVPSCLAMRVL